MNRPLTAVFAAFEAVIVVGIGFGALLAPLTAAWAVTYGLRVDWTVFYRAAADGWLLGHGVDLTVAPDAAGAAITGVTGASAPYEVTIAALGIGLITLLLATRVGRRLRVLEHPAIAAGTAVVVFAALSTVLALTAGATVVSPSVLQGILLPTGVFVLGLALGAVLSGQEISSEQLSRVQSSARDALPFDPRGRAALLVSWSVRLGAASASAVLAVSAVIVAVLLAVNYATIVTLYESVQGGALGGGVLTVAQLLLLPNLVVWATSWLIGPGFAIGVGSSVSPLGTVLGPLPSLPIFGALPTGASAFGYLGVLVPVAAAFLIGALLRRGVSRDLGADRPLMGVLAVGVGSGLAGGVLLGLIAWIASGSAGPGRLVEVGADPFLVAVFSAIEIGIASILGLLTGFRRPD
ncbi:cell division protein PerM [Naasia lichenicola]|uniref:Uncharacterized protein n=1 Tax=Naasia lichenicola TaxID=2565933 RepID=A0A4V3WSX1_9MICO|nr:DUF6350 family protein [Naasia lichenicola]THG29777.1 hypothetical protein E6C64_14020 [Naasia lichenicola]